MNKIMLGNDKIFLQDNSMNYLNIDEYKKINVELNENFNAKIIIVSTNNYDIDILLNKNSKLVVNSLNKDNSVNVKINLKENSNVIYNHSVLGNMDSDNKFYINHLENNSTSILNNNGINRNDAKLYFRIDGIIPKNLKEISCSQNSRIINFSYGDSKIIPNLIIDSNDIIANHSAYVGEIDENVKFYLASRGINDVEIEKLIYRGTLLGKMELSKEKEEFNNLINEWW